MQDIISAPVESNNRRPPLAKPLTNRRSCLLAILVCISTAGTASLTLTGCGYTVGSTYQAEIRSIYVPTFTTDSFRRGIEFQLTEAVHKEIQAQTHFRLVKQPQADTRLIGHIVDVRKDRLGETGFDDPREVQFQLAVEVTWEDLRTGEILMQQRMPIAPESVHLLSTGDVAPELGQSYATGAQDAIDRMARQIVQMMETPW
jgi:hypothetical protein